MALLHPRATISPTKEEVVRQWLDAAAWFTAPAADVTVVRREAYRLDDPAGQVGVEGLLAHHGDDVLHVPVTYRDVPLQGGDDWLVTTMEHSVLGPRWVYAAAGDPVFVAEAVRAVLAGTPTAGWEVELDGQVQAVEVPVRARGTGSGGRPGHVTVERHEVSGSDTLVHTSAGVLVVHHEVQVLDAPDPSLVATWDGSGGEVLLLELRV